MSVYPYLFKFDTRVCIHAILVTVYKDADISILSFSFLSIDIHIESFFFSLFMVKGQCNFFFGNI